MHYIGIDPGKSGGLALLNQDGTVAAVTKMPDTERDLCDWLETWQDAGQGSGSNGADHGIRPIKAMLERVNAGAWGAGKGGQKMGVSSAFTFGMGYGVLRGVLTALRIPFDLVSPQKWQGEIGCLTKGQKNVSKAKAQQLFPNVKVTHANADALLIAEYCRRSEVPFI